METVGVNGASRLGAIDLETASLAPSNSNEGISPDFIAAATQLGREQIANGEAAAGANPYDIVLAGIAQTLTTVVNVSSFDFDSGPD